MTANALVNLLKSVGFSKARQVGSHIILNYPNRDSIIVVPMSGDKELRPSVLTTIKKNIVEKGIISESEFTQLSAK